MPTPLQKKIRCHNLKGIKFRSQKKGFADFHSVIISKTNKVRKTSIPRRMKPTNGAEALNLRGISIPAV